ncbi:hypothetical protein DFH09DRAFT_1341971 [Mycena vulgaris]|nr:hypothetical protein DFH09DRAFT_1341971 [Mycena vulgaris]
MSLLYLCFACALRERRSCFVPRLSFPAVFSFPIRLRGVCAQSAPSFPLPSRVRSRTTLYIAPYPFAHRLRTIPLPVPAPRFVPFAYPFAHRAASFHIPVRAPYCAAPLPVHAPCCVVPHTRSRTVLRRSTYPFAHRAAPFPYPFTHRVASFHIPVRAPCYVVAPHTRSHVVPHTRSRTVLRCNRSRSRTMLCRSTYPFAHRGASFPYPFTHRVASFPPFVHRAVHRALRSVLVPRTV